MGNSDIKLAMSVLILRHVSTNRHQIILFCKFLGLCVTLAHQFHYERGDFVHLAITILKMCAQINVSTSHVHCIYSPIPRLFSHLSQGINLSGGQKVCLSVWAIGR